jgi:hypothetical protein
MGAPAASRRVAAQSARAKRSVPVRQRAQIQEVLRRYSMTFIAAVVNDRGIPNAQD